MGFTFDDTDTKGVATPLAEMRRLIDEDPRNAERDLPVHRRRGGQHEPDACAPPVRDQLRRPGEDDCRRRWPELMAIVEERVKPERMATEATPARRRRGGTSCRARVPSSRQRSRGLERVLVIARVEQARRLRVPPRRHASTPRTRRVFRSATNAAFCALQSRPHEVWARFFGSSMKDDLRYTPSDCFETFPFPEAGRPTRRSKPPARPTTTSAPP